MDHLLNLPPFFNLATGEVVSTSGGAAEIQAVGNGWYRCSVTKAAVGTNSGFGVIAGPSADGVNAAFLGDGTSGIYLWGADLRPADQSALPYQRVNTATDYDAGPAFPRYLKFDGIDDSLVTGTITPGTDKVQVFAGVRKLSDAARGIILELGDGSVGTNSNVLIDAASSSTNAGASSPFANFSSVVHIGPNQGVPDFAAHCTTNTYASPLTSVLAAQFDVALANSLASQLRVNGQSAARAAAAFTGAAISGNLPNAQLFIGRRNNASLPFNGHIYQLVSRFGPNLTADQIAQAETFFNQKTGAY